MRLTLSFLLLLCAPYLTAQPLPKGVTQGASVEGITEYKLDNGMRVLLFPDDSKPKVTVNITVMVGSKNENYGEIGRASCRERV